MTTNTYQLLCDDVEAYEYNNSYKPIRNNLERINNNFIPNFEPDEILKLLDINKKYYYDKSAEQRERLEELILKNNFNFLIVSCFGKYVYFIFNSFTKKVSISQRAKTRPDALYALIHKLVAEGVLSKEEVAKALKEGK
jgi:hypothetical protein